MGKTLSISKQAIIANHKSEVNQSSGIEAVHIITPFTDGTAELLIMASQKPGINRVDLLPRTALTARGVFETTAQAKYMADLAALKTFFGLVNVGDTAAAIGLSQIKLDGGGVFWDTSVATFPSPIFASTAAENRVTADGNHKLLNYFNNTTGTFDATPAAPIVAAGDPVADEKNFLGLTSTQTWIGAGLAGLAGLIIWDPKNWFWNRKPKTGGKAKAERYS